MTFVRIGPRKMNAYKIWQCCEYRVSYVNEGQEQVHSAWSDRFDVQLFITRNSLLAVRDASLVTLVRRFRHSRCWHILLMVMGAFLDQGTLVGSLIMGQLKDTMGKINTATLMIGRCSLICIFIYVFAKSFGSPCLFDMLIGMACGTFGQPLGPPKC